MIGRTSEQQLHDALRDIERWQQAAMQNLDSETSLRARRALIALRKANEAAQRARSASIDLDTSEPANNSGSSGPPAGTPCKRD
jgi:hypothetical protein